MQTTMLSLEQDVFLKSKFLSGCHLVQALVEAEHTDEDLLEFYVVLLPKFGHARFNESWNSKCKLATVGLSKEGESLRDKMYTFASMGTNKRRKGDIKTVKENKT